MCYILCMNKDVIYIEPEDDITDIITKIENAKEKIVALVPPKKAGVLRSVVNIKLITKAAVNAKKTVVLVTTDPSILKLAAATKLPVTKDLQSAPSIPEAEVEDEKPVKEEVVEKEETDVGEDEDEKNGENEEESEEAEESEDEGKKSEEDEKEEKEEKKKSEPVAKKERKSENKFVAFCNEHKTLLIVCGILGLILIIVLIWALAIAPAVNVFVSIKTDTNNFSESVSFVKEQSEEDIKEGKIYLEERKIETTSEVSFEATGKKNIGEKAKGEVKVYAYFPLNVRAMTQIAQGEVFTISGLTYRATESVELKYSGVGKNECANKDNWQGLVEYGCRINGTVSVEASEPGTKYNIAASSTGWDTNARVFAYSDSSMVGGTDEVITIVQPSDIEKARNELNNGKESENKEKLYETISDDNLIVESTFKQITSAAVSTPAVNEEVKEGVKPTLKTTTTISVYIIEKTIIE